MRVKQNQSEIHVWCCSTGREATGRAAECVVAVVLCVCACVGLSVGGCKKIIVSLTVASKPSVPSRSEVHPRRSFGG